MAGIVALLVALVGGTVYAAQDSLPGDALYPVKLTTERVGLAVGADESVRAERALSFADKRVREIQALAGRGRSQDLDLAVGKYGYALNVTVAMMERANNRGVVAGDVTARVAEATAGHLLVLDRVWDMVPSEARDAIAHAMNVSQSGYFQALAALARNDTSRAADINLAAMQGRLNRVRAALRNMEALQIALGQFEGMSEFNEEISRVAEETGLNATGLEELLAEAYGKHMLVLAEVWQQVPEQARPAIERAMANVTVHYQRRVQSLEQRGVKVPPSPAIPGKVGERIQERLWQRIQERQQWGPDQTTPAGQQGDGGVGGQNPGGST
jgi:uncharacterized damage-inducible protein DinB